jgi:hypothetical protein
MSNNTTTVKASIQTVWQILADGWSYEKWVVGAESIRDVDKSWPQNNSKLYHRVSAGPAKSSDSTKVINCIPQKHLELEGRARPYGVARIIFDLRERGNETEISVSERVVKGPGALLPNTLQDLALKPRNARTLDKLSKLAESRS